MSAKWPPFCSCLSMLGYQLSIWQITNSWGLNPVPLYVRCCLYIKDMSLECYPTFTKCHWIIHPTTVSEQIELYMKCKGMQLRRCYYLRSYCEIWLTPWVLKKMAANLHALHKKNFINKHGTQVIEMTKICICFMCITCCIKRWVFISWEGYMFFHVPLCQKLIEELPYVGWNGLHVIAWFLQASQFSQCHGVSSCDNQQMDILDSTVMTPVASSGKISLLVAVWLQSGWMRLQWHEVNEESNWYTSVVKVKHLNRISKGLLVLPTDVVSFWILNC